MVWSRGFGASKAFAVSEATSVAVEVKEIAVDGREIRRIEDWTNGRRDRRFMTGSTTVGL